MDSGSIGVSGLGVGIDCLTYTVLSNHLHIVLRSRPDVVRQWSDTEVARRWLRLFPKRRDAEGNPAEPENHELNMITSDPKRLAEIRQRLSDVSWWMRCTRKILLGEAIRKISVRGGFGKGVTRHSSFWMKRRCWPALRMLI